MLLLSPLQKGVSSAGDVDTAAVCAGGFPAFLGEFHNRPARRMVGNLLIPEKLLKIRPAFPVIPSSKIHDGQDSHLVIRQEPSHGQLHA